MIHRMIAGVALLTLGTAPALAETRDGHLFDHGATMTEISERAGEDVARMAFLRGQWDVTTTTYTEGEATHQATAVASTSLMNRGHGFLERYQCDDFDGEGNERATVAFLTQTPTTGTWNLGWADSWRENVTLLAGDFNGDDLVLETIIRYGGSGPLIHSRVTIAREDDNRFSLLAEQANFREEFKPVWKRSYTRRTEVAGFMAGQGIGEAAPDLPEEAHQFDFILGEWDEQHHMTFPDGREARWPVNGTAVRILNGHAIMEHAWYDVDPNVPDAATTIVRIYNRAMRRWESMYTTNRFSNVLYFGGVKEGEDIVLHAFNANAAGGNLSYWTFHSMQPDSYGWFANTSNDRGKTFKKTWIISATRKAESQL